MATDTCGPLEGMVEPELARVYELLSIIEQYVGEVERDMDRSSLAVWQDVLDLTDHVRDRMVLSCDALREVIHMLTGFQQQHGS